MIASHFLNSPLAQKLKAKEEKQKQRKKAKWLEELSPKDATILKSTLSQVIVTSQLQIEHMDAIFEIQGVNKHYPLLKDFQNEMVKLANDLFNISVKTEEDEKNKIEFEKMMYNIVATLPKLNIKKLEMLENFALNLKNKK